VSPERASAQTRTTVRLVVWVPLAFVLLVAHLTGALAGGLQWAAAGVQNLSGAPQPPRPAPAEPPGADTSAYAFSATAPGSADQPVTWEDCTPIRVVLNPAHAPEGAVQDMITAVRTIADVSGLPFRYDGLVDDTLTAAWGGDAEHGWAPVLVAWVDPSSGLLDEDNAARAYTTTYTVGGRSSLVTGAIAVNTRVDMTAGFEGPSARGPVFLHELGHIAGLAHVDDPGQLMYPYSGSATRFGAGDVAGLHALAAEACPQE